MTTKSAVPVVKLCRCRRQRYRQNVSFSEDCVKCHIAHEKSVFRFSYLSPWDVFVPDSDDEKGRSGICIAIENFIQLFTTPLSSIRTNKGMAGRLRNVGSAVGVVASVITRFACSRSFVTCIVLYYLPSRDFPLPPMTRWGLAFTAAINSITSERGVRGCWAKLETKKGFSTIIPRSRRTMVLIEFPNGVCSQYLYIFQRSCFCQYIVVGWQFVDEKIRFVHAN